jgi:hypothetical protein
MQLLGEYFPILRILSVNLFRYLYSSNSDPDMQQKATCDPGKNVTGSRQGILHIYLSNELGMDSGEHWPVTIHREGIIDEGFSMFFSESEAFHRSKSIVYLYSIAKSLQKP